MIKLKYYIKKAMEYIQQNINFQKTKLLNLINNLINTQLINQEIYINNEIKKESELLSSFLIEKQKYVISQNSINNNIINPFLMPQPNLMMNAPQMNINPIKIPQVEIIDDNLNNLENANQKNVLNIKFEQLHSGNKYLVQCFDNDRICDVIEMYRKKANDYNDNFFLFNMKDMNGLAKTLNDIGIVDSFSITVDKKGILKGGEKLILISN